MSYALEQKGSKLFQTHKIIEEKKDSNGYLLKNMTAENKPNGGLDREERR